MPPYGLYSLTDRVNIPEELAARGYGEDILYDYDPAFGGLKTTERYQPAPFTGVRPFQAMYDIAPYTSNGINLGFNADLYNPSFGGTSGYRDTGGIMGIEPVRYSADFDTSYGVANEEDEEQVEYLPGQEPQGIAKLFKTIGDIYNMLPTPLNLIRSIGDRIEPYQQFSPGTTIRDGIVSVAGVNTPYSAFGGDFYNPRTGLNRFDRAAQRFAKTGSTMDLFASSRTLADFFKKRKEIEAAKQASVPVSSAPTSGGGGSYTPSISPSQAASNRESRRGGQYK